MSLTQVIKEYAHSLEFELVGVTTSDPLPHAGVYKCWLEQGRHGEMAYLEGPRSRHVRADPGLVFPGCRSVIVLGMAYAAPAAVSSTDDLLRGKIAAYALGEDYHLVLPDRLRALVAYIESQVGEAVPNRWYTDTGPLLERELAQRAGLGWIGKNTCLINPHRGSYFLLAEILLGIELEPDVPFTYDRCGACTRCIQACPTGCILPDRTLDARRCISYLTIELKGSIPLDLRSRMDGWIFGCDICQQACPWNRFATREAEPAFMPHIANPYPDLPGEMALGQEEFSLKYRRSPLMRTKRRGYLRNTAVALGNSRHLDAIQTLMQALLYEPEALVRGHAAWALGKIGGEAARQALEKSVALEGDPVVRSEILRCLEGMG